MTKTNFQNSPTPIRVRKPIRVGGQRNPHGTLICRRIVCKRCNKADYISSRVEKFPTLCRACAQRDLGVFEPGVEIPEEMASFFCCKCGISSEIQKSVIDKKELTDEELLCRDCLWGFDVWVGVLNSNSKKTPLVGKTRLAGTLLRKKKKSNEL